MEVIPIEVEREEINFGSAQVLAELRYQRPNGLFRYERLCDQETLALERPKLLGDEGNVAWVAVQPSAAESVEQQLVSVVLQTVAAPDLDEGCLLYTSPSPRD